MDYLMIIVLVVLVVEIILSATWNYFYFSKGIKIFTYKLQGINIFDRIPSPETLSERFSKGWSGSFLFRAISPKEIAFREKMIELKLFTYTPVMHGIILIEPERREIKILGFINWWICGFAIISIGMSQSIHKDGYIFTIGAIGIIGLIYFIQSVRYRKIGAEIESELKSGV